jgi:hypothetical protein
MIAMLPLSILVSNIHARAEIGNQFLLFFQLFMDLFFVAQNE